ncbi:MAG: hypothetical protein ABI587_18110 [Gemmatimonadales bacterium]
MTRLRPTPLASVLFLLGCGEVVSGGGGGGPSAGQSFELMLATQDEIEASSVAFTVAGIGLPPGVTIPLGCSDSTSTTDGDGDGVPTNATVTFTNPPCSITGVRGGTLGLTGSIQVEDASSGNSTAWLTTLTNLAWQVTDSGHTRTYTATRNGTRARGIGTGGKATLITNLTTFQDRPNVARATVDVQLLTTFTPAGSSTVTPTQPPPSGTLLLAGTLRWRRSSEDWQLDVGTVTPLVYDSTCAGPQRITAGELALTGTVHNQDGTLSLVWSACGTDPARSWTPSGS